MDNLSGVVSVCGGSVVGVAVADIVISNAYTLLLTQVSFTQQCLSYITVTISGLMEFNVTTPDIESGSASFTVSLNDFMVDVCHPRQAIFHGSGIEKSIEVDIQLPSCKLQ